MPYKFEKKHIAKKDDKRIKLTQEDKDEIQYRYLKVGGVSQRALAKEYAVSRSSIVYAIYPERREHNYQLRVARGGSKVYYDRIRNNEYMQAHREHKKQLDTEGKLL